MKIHNFKAEDVYGYLNFDINFHSNLNFLVGGNGSGKTTVLKLINGLLTPNFKILLTIPFKKIELSIIDRNETLTINCESDDENITLYVSTDLQNKLKLQKYSLEELDTYSKTDNPNEVINEINRKYGNHPVIKCISKIHSPLYLGIDRKKDNYTSSFHDFDEVNESRRFRERERILMRERSRAARANRLQKGALDVSLFEIQLLIQDTYSRFKEVEDRQGAKLRDSILSSSFDYIEFNPEDVFATNIKDKIALLARRDEIKSAISNITGLRKNLNMQIDEFFDKLTSLIEQQSGDDDEDNFNIEWLTNKSQIDRVLGLVNIIDEYKSKTDLTFKPIDNFLSTVNEFFTESDKYISIDKVGRLSVRKPNKSECSITALSSGESQLLTIFAHVFLNKYSHNKEIAFIIDEPELSLHLKWQEMFSEKLNELNKGVQFIFATHSPDIVGEHKNSAINVSIKVDLNRYSTENKKKAKKKKVD